MNRPLTVLVVDDEPDFAELVRKVAEALGHRVLVATDHGAMRTQFAAATPDIIVLDVVMPQMDGIEVTRWLAGCGYRGRILLVTGFNPLYAEAAKVVGETQGQMEIRVLAKPVPLAALRTALTL
jgi:CheY-like chemotaxis protein